MKISKLSLMLAAYLFLSCASHSRYQVATQYINSDAWLLNDLPAIQIAVSDAVYGMNVPEICRPLKKEILVDYVVGANPYIRDQVIIGIPLCAYNNLSSDDRERITTRVSTVYYFPTQQTDEVLDIRLRSY